MRLNLMLMISAIFLSFLNTAQASQSYVSKYSGEERRKIKSLSVDDINQLEQGKGWGLAKAAELNGMPGPIHVLQMKEKISLTKQQEKKIKALYDQMKTEAIPLGKRLIKLEKQLNDMFADKSVNETSLRQQLTLIAEVRMKLRYVHLATHLKTPDVLSMHQINLYNRLRGYGEGMVHHKGMHAH